MPGSIWLPSELFNFFPYYNFKVITPKPAVVILNKTLENTTAEELNELSIEEFQMIMDSPPAHYVSTPSSIQLQYANNPNLNETERSIMVDRLIADDNEPDLVQKLLKLYNETDNVEVKNTTVQDLMLYNQRHIKIKSYINNEQPLLKQFFEELLDSKSLTPRMIDDGIRGFIDTHSNNEIMGSKDKINKLLSSLNPYSSVMLKYTLIYKSKELQRIYIKSIINELRKENNSDLDSYFFGPLLISYKNMGENLLEPESKQIIIDYLNEVHNKYSPQGIKKQPNDFHRTTTAPYYFELIKNMGI
ncbi:hypothetical protein [Legionella sp.]|uniref:hypothetical protein n=1 Tax=Legionella sp. TaxID=459 RepID=UPI003CBC8A01